MKNLLLISLLVAGLLTASNAIAQKEELTTKIATKKMGYTILNAGDKIVIYKYYHSAHPPKAAEKYPVKYYFLVQGAENLQDLSLTNLKKAFPENHSFHDALDANFKEDKELYAYDDFHKMYKINWLLKENSK